MSQRDELKDGAAVSGERPTGKTGKINFWVWAAARLNVSRLFLRRGCSGLTGKPLTKGEKRDGVCSSKLLRGLESNDQLV